MGMLEGWQGQIYDQTKSLAEPIDHWIPKSDTLCLPNPYNVTPPFRTKQFGCVGPNNCFSDSYKTTLGILLIIFILLNHLFVKIGLQGPLATFLRERQRRRDREKHGEDHYFLSSDGETESDESEGP